MCCNCCGISFGIPCCLFYAPLSGWLHQEPCQQEGSTVLGQWSAKLQAWVQSPCEGIWLAYLLLLTDLCFFLPAWWKPTPRHLDQPGSNWYYVTSTCQIAVTTCVHVCVWVWLCVYECVTDYGWVWVCVSVWLSGCECEWVWPCVWVGVTECVCEFVWLSGCECECMWLSGCDCVDVSMSGCDWVGVCECVWLSMCECVCVCVRGWMFTTSLCQAVQDVSGSSYIFPTWILESASSIKNPGSFYCRTVLEIKIQKVDVLVATGVSFLLCSLPDKARVYMCMY